MASKCNQFESHSRMGGIERITFYLFQIVGISLALQSQEFRRSLILPLPVWRLLP
jgi:hypothetical protein